MSEQTIAPTRTSELGSALWFIVFAAAVFWLPLVWWFTGGNMPWSLFSALRDGGLALMFMVGAIIANATAVGGGMVFNPTLQLVFGVTGFSALSLAVLVQCAGMPCGAYGWFVKGEFANVRRRDIVNLTAATVGSAVVFQLIFLWLAWNWPKEVVLVMRLASALVSFYVFKVVWSHIGESREEAAENAGAPAELRVDARIQPWLYGGVALNVATSLGIGELVTSHLIKLYNWPAKTSVAVGALLQTACVWTQAVFIVLFFREHILLSIVLIGVMFCVAGGRLAPLVLSLPAIEPYAKHILAFAALAMGVTSLALIVLAYLF